MTLLKRLEEVMKMHEEGDDDDAGRASGSVKAGTAWKRLRQALLLCLQLSFAFVVLGPSIFLLLFERLLCTANLNSKQSKIKYQRLLVLGQIRR